MQESRVESKKTEVNKNIDYYNQLKSDYERVFSTTEGKRVLDDIMISGYMTKTSFNSESPYITAKNEGLRSLALHIKFMAEKENEYKQEPKNEIV